MTYSKRYKLKDEKKKHTHKKLPKNKKLRKKKLRRITRIDSWKRLLILSFVLLISISLFTVIYILVYLQNISQDLPSPDKPFGKKTAATEIYDRNGQLLYRVFDEEDRDPVILDEIPPILIWSYLAAEDIKFYEHEGIDFEAISRCGIRLLETRTITCGGSTITQQLIRKTALTDDVEIARKLKEMLLAMKIEQVRSKNEILEMYLTVVPGGSNIYGVTRASKFYFGKEPKDLTLAEMAILASIPQNPSILSPTKSVNPEISADLLAQRKNYVLNQLENNIAYINANLESMYDGESIRLAPEMIEQARKEQPVYQDPSFRIRAPHFVFYAIDSLQKNGYKNGGPFALEEIETEGLRIYTTLDLEIQKAAETQVIKAVETYGRQFGAENAGLVILDPKTGEVLAMVGSYDYFGKPSPENCTVGRNCKFEPQVNVVDSLQAYGSTLKPMIYYQAFMKGMTTPESLLNDSPIKIKNYTPKNYDGKFIGVNTTRHMLVQSRNIPAIIMLDEIGVPNFINFIKQWGYTTMNNPNGYGVSLAVGGGEIKLIEHVQAYGVLANNGLLTQHEVIRTIKDKNGEDIFNYKPISTQVADPRGIYLVNDILNGNKGGPGFSFDGRDLSGKTGTSEDQKETLYIAYSPEIVVGSILINNDNSPMVYGATGLTSVRPWVGEFLQTISDKFPPTSFVLPEGVEVRPDGDLFVTGISVEPSGRVRNYQNYIDRR